MLSRHSQLGLVLALAVAGAGVTAQAGVIWDGGGGATTSWGTATNWDSDTLPAFDGTDQISITTGFGANTALSLGADRSIARITFGGGTTAISLAAGNTLRLNSTTTTGIGTGTALWNSNTDSKAATVDANILLQSGTAGTYTGHFRENLNTTTGTQFNGVISQGAGENWTMRFSQNSARGFFRLNNAGNNVAGIYNQNTTLTSLTPGSFGSALLTLGGGLTGTGSVEHYTTAMSNNITLAGTATWFSDIATRLTGTLTQSTQTLTYGGASLSRLEYAGVTGTGSTAISSGAVAPSDMTKFASGNLNLSSNLSGGVLVLSGTSGNSLPTWSDFTTARGTYGTGAGAWQITGAFGGGFAARGADLTIASGSGVTSTTFARNFTLGSTASQGGSRYANNAVKIAADIDLTAATLTTASNIWTLNIANNAAVVRSTTAWTFGGPVHELNGVITEKSGGMIITALAGSSTNYGVVRITNTTNSLANSRWILAGQRNAWVTPGGFAMAATSGSYDNSGAVFIFTSDAAFGNALEVTTVSQPSSGSTGASFLMFEDANAGGNTTFARNFYVMNTSNTAAGFGSWAGDVVYTGTATLTGSQADTPITVRAGTMQLGVTAGSGATFTNNRSVATNLHVSGAGVLDVRNLTVNGTQALNAWTVRGGASLRVNQTLATNGVTVATGSILGGAGKITGTTTVQNGGHIAPGNSPGILNTDNFTMSAGAIYDWQRLGGGTPVYDQVLIATGKTLTISGAWTLNLYDLGGDPAVLADKFYLFRVADNNYAGTAGTVTIAHKDWIQTPTVGADSNGIYLTNIPEPTSLSLLGLGAAGLLLRRRRQA
jgi:fibronectin-binding autotransporter adhesin